MVHNTAQGRDSIRELSYGGDSVVRLDTDSSLNLSKFNFTSCDDESVVETLEMISFLTPSHFSTPKKSLVASPKSKSKVHPSQQPKRKFVSKLPRAVKPKKETTKEQMEKMFASFVEDEPRTPRKMRRSNIGRLVSLSKTPEQAMKSIQKQIELHNSFF